MRACTLQRTSVIATHVTTTRREVRESRLQSYDTDIDTVAVDWTSVQLNTFSAVCAVAFNPINRQAIDTAVEAASCKASGKYPENDEDSEPEDKYDSHESMPTKWIGAKSIVVPIASTASVRTSRSMLLDYASDYPVEKCSVLVCHAHSSSDACAGRGKRFFLLLVSD